MNSCRRFGSLRRLLHLTGFQADNTAEAAHLAPGQGCCGCQETRVVDARDARVLREVLGHGPRIGAMPFHARGASVLMPRSTR